MVRTMSTLPASHTKCNTLALLDVSSSTLVPELMSSCTTSTNPAIAAQCNAVLPLLSTASIAAPFGLGGGRGGTLVSQSA